MEYVFKFMRFGGLTRAILKIMPSGMHDCRFVDRCQCL
jgi:hypothetical protein